MIIELLIWELKLLNKNKLNLLIFKKPSIAVIDNFFPIHQVSKYIVDAVSYRCIENENINLWFINRLGKSKILIGSKEFIIQ